MRFVTVFLTISFALVVACFNGTFAGEVLDEKFSVDLRVSGNAQTVWRPGQSTSDLMLCRPSVSDWRCAPAEEAGALLADDVNDIDRRVRALENARGPVARPPQVNVIGGDAQTGAPELSRIERIEADIVKLWDLRGREGEIDPEPAGPDPKVTELLEDLNKKLDALAADQSVFGRRIEVLEGLARSRDDEIRSVGQELELLSARFDRLKTGTATPEMAKSLVDENAAGIDARIRALEEGGARFDDYNRAILEQQSTLASLTRQIETLTADLQSTQSVPDSIDEISLSVKETGARLDETADRIIARLTVLEERAAEETGRTTVPRARPQDVNERLLETLQRLENRLSSVESDQDEIGAALDRILSTPMPPMPSGGPDRMPAAEDGDTAESARPEEERAIPLPDVSADEQQIPLTAQAAQKLLDALRSVLGRTPPMN